MLFSIPRLYLFYTLNNINELKIGMDNGHCILEELDWMHTLLSSLLNCSFSIFSCQPPSSDIVQGFDSLRLLNLEDNCIADWNEILKLSQLKRYLKRKSL